MALRDPQSAAIRTVGQARPFFVAYDLSDRRERLVSYNCAQRRYRSAMSFQTALFSLVRRRLPICPHSMACFGVPLIDSRVASRLVFWLVLRLEFNSNACAPLRPHSHLPQDSFAGLQPEH